MSAPTVMEDPHSGLPLNQFSRNVPPGWRPGNPKYPLKLYLQLLRLWWRQTELTEAAAGPTMCGRLRGNAFQMALKIVEERLDLNIGATRPMTGDELLAQPSHDAWTNPTTGTVFDGAPAGATVLMNRLVQEYGMHVQDQNVAALEAFFTFERGSLTLSDYLTVWTLLFDDACVQTGLQVNNVGKSFMLLWKSGLSQ